MNILNEIRSDKMEGHCCMWDIEYEKYKDKVTKAVNEIRKVQDEWQYIEQANSMALFRRVNERLG